MTDTFQKEAVCVLCQQTFSPVIEPEEDAGGYEIHCSSCPKWVFIARGDSVRVALREVLKLEGEALALAVQTYLNTCPCGSEFSHDAGKRCLDCLAKIKKEVRHDSADSKAFVTVWNIEKMKQDFEGKAFDYILDRLDSEEESLTQLIIRFEAGELDPGAYMDGIEAIQIRESRDRAVIKWWAMMAGPEMAFRGADEHGLSIRYGSQVLINIAAALESAYGISPLTSLAKEEKNLDGPLRKELQMYLKKIAGGF